MSKNEKENLREERTGKENERHANYLLIILTMPENLKIFCREIKGKVNYFFGTKCSSLCSFPL